MLIALMGTTMVGNKKTPGHNFLWQQRFDYRSFIRDGTSSTANVKKKEG
jgi:hypothetical protein